MTAVQIPVNRTATHGAHEMRLPAAILTESDILAQAAQALTEREALRKASQDADDAIRALCRQWGDCAGLWGVAPHHLAQACKARGLI